MGSGRLEFWEGPYRNIPRLRPQDEQLLYERYAHEFSSLCRAPFLPRDEIEARQIQRIGELLEMACDIPLYRDAFFNVRAAPYHFTSLTDLARFPIITKRMFIEAGPYRCIRHTTFPYTYPTRSSGSSGLVLMLGFDPNAVISDTLQGARQLILQSDGRLSPRELTMHYYTQPWYTGHINGDWRSGFISSLIAPQRAADFLRDARPTAFGSYPSLVQALIPHIAPGDFPLKLIVTNSEQSSRSERDTFSAHFGCPVLDEYSSEELTRIALEMPDGYYYVHEDSVYLEILHPITREPVEDGEWGEAVITGLLNEAMPFIRYATGDMVRVPKEKTRGWQGINWRQLDALGGRIIDSFRAPDGALIPSGTLLDVIYRALSMCDMLIEQYELVQIAPTQVVFKTSAPNTDVRPLIVQVKTFLDMIFGTPVRVEHAELDAHYPIKKRRPIRCELS